MTSIPPNDYQATRSDSSIKPTQVFECYNNSSSYHLWALHWLSQLRGVGTFGSRVHEALQKTVRFSTRQWGSSAAPKARDSMQTQTLESQPLKTKQHDSESRPRSFLPQWPARLIRKQIQVAKKHLAIGNDSREILMGWRGEPLPQKHRFSRMADFKLSPVCWFLWSRTHCIEWILKYPNLCRQEVQCNNCTWCFVLALSKDS